LAKQIDELSFEIQKEDARLVGLQRNSDLVAQGK
jgi:hypothetical protein